MYRKIGYGRAYGTIQKIIKRRNAESEALKKNGRKRSNATLTPMNATERDEFAKKFNKLCNDNAETLRKWAEEATWELGEDRAQSILNSACRHCLSGFYKGKFVFLSDGQSLKLLCGFIGSKVKRELDRKTRRNNRFSIDHIQRDANGEEFDAVENHADSKSTSPVETVERQEERYLFDRAAEATLLSFNDESYRKIYEGFCKGLKFAEIAKELKIDVQTVRNRFSKIEEKIRFWVSSHIFFRDLFVLKDFPDAAEEANWSLEVARQIYEAVEQRWKQKSKEPLIPYEVAYDVDKKRVEQCNALCGYVFNEWYDCLIKFVKSDNRNKKNNLGKIKKQKRLLKRSSQR